MELKLVFKGVTFQKGHITFSKITLAYKNQGEFHNSGKNIYPLKKAGIFLHILLRMAF